jgi:two-component system chemotaxis response regulator CheY
MKILAVDDEFVSRSRICRLLEAYGDCASACSGEEALELFLQAHSEQQPYELITMDIDMPGLSGPEVVKQIRSYEQELGITSLESAVKILMVTAMNDGKTIMASFKEGCEGYVTKPFNKEAIRKSLSTIGLEA